LAEEELFYHKAMESYVSLKANLYQSLFFYEKSIPKDED